MRRLAIEALLLASTIYLSIAAPSYLTAFAAGFAVAILVWQPLASFIVRGPRVEIRSTSGEDE